MSPENEIVQTEYAAFIGDRICRAPAFIHEKLGVGNRAAGFVVEHESNEAAVSWRFDLRRVHRRTKESLREKLTGVGLKSPAADQGNQGEPEYAKARQDSPQYAS